MVAALLTVLAGGCTVSYKFNGASIDYTKVKSISITDFPNMAELVYAPLSSTFSEALRDKYTRQTKLQLLRTGGDLLEPWIAGSIAGVKGKGLTDAREVFGCWYRQAEELGVPLPPLEEMLAACLST